MTDKERELKVRLGRKMAANLSRLMETLDQSTQKLVEFINSGIWATEDYINVHDRSFSALASLAQARIRAIRELRELISSGILDEETIRTISQETETLQNKALEDDRLKSIIEELQVSIKEVSESLNKSSKEDQDAT